MHQTAIAAHLDRRLDDISASLGALNEDLGFAVQRDAPPLGALVNDGIAAAHPTVTTVTRAGLGGRGDRSSSVKRNPRMRSSSSASAATNVVSAIAMS